MPMLTTLRIGLPVWPFHSPERTRSLNARMRPSTSCTCLTTSTPSTSSDCAVGHAQRDVQHRTILRDVDALAAEHRVDALAQPALLRELQEQPHRLVGDAILRVIEVQPLRLDGEALAARRIAREQLAQVHPAISA